MAVLAPFAGNVALVVVFLLQFLLVGLLERIAAKNPKGFPFAHPFGHRSGNSNVVQKGHKDNAQSVTCVHKLLLSHTSVGSKFGEPSSTQQCGPCDACKFTECIFQCRGVTHESIRTPSCSNVARDIPNSLQIVVHLC